MNERELTIALKAKDEASKVVSDFNKKTKSEFDAVRKAVGTAMTVAGGAITGFLGTSIKSAAASEKAWATVGQQVRLSGLDFEDTMKKAQNFAGEMQSLTGYSDEYVGELVGRVLPNVKNFDEATKMAKMALDIESSGVASAEMAIKGLSAAKEGDIMMLRRYVPELRGVDEELLKGMDAAQKYAFATEALGRQFGGIAEEQGKTFEGQLNTLKQTFDDLQEKIGDKVIPILESLLDKIKPIIDKIMEWIDKNPELAEKIVLVAGAVGGLMLVLGPLLLALPGLISLFTILAGPIGIVFAAIGALVAIVIYLAKTFKEFSESVKIIWKELEKFLKPIIDNIIGFFENLIKPIDRLIEKFTKLFDLVKSVSKNIGSFVSGAVGTVKGVLGFQEGGIVTKPTLAMIGEAGPEAVIPLRSGYTFGNINVSITGNTISSELDMRELARKVGDEITKRIKLNIRI